MATTFFSRLWNHTKNFLTQQQDTPIKDGAAWLTGGIVFVSTTFLGFPIDPGTAAVLAGLIMRTIAGAGAPNTGG